MRLRLPSDRHARAIYIEVMLVKPHCQGNTTAVALAACWVLPRLVIGSCLVLGSYRGLPHTGALMGTNIGAWHEDRAAEAEACCLFPFGWVFGQPQVAGFVTIALTSMFAPARCSGR